MAKKETKAMTIPGPKSVQELRKELGIELELDQIDIVFPTISIIHQGQIFEMPDGMKQESFEGIILDIYNINAWWAESFDATGGGTPPDCFSMDGLVPDQGSEIVQNADCSSCPLNQFGTEKGGRGKACKNMKRIHIVFEDELIPTRLTVPPSNIKLVNKYVTALAKKSFTYYMAVTRFGLKEASNKDGISYSQLILTVAQDAEGVPQYIMNKDLILGVQGMKKKWLNEMREAEIMFQEYEEPEQEGDPDESST